MTSKSLWWPFSQPDIVQCVGDLHNGNSKLKEQQWSKLWSKALNDGFGFSGDSGNSVMQRVTQNDVSRVALIPVKKKKLKNGSEIVW